MGPRAVALGAALGLAACAAEPPPPPRLDPGRPPLLLAVGALDILDRRQPLAQANFIDERRGDELAAAARTYLDGRIRAGGGAGVATAVIERASLTERLRPGRRRGVLGLLTAEPTYDLAGDLAVKVIVLDEAGRERAAASAAVGRVRAARAGASVAARDEEARRVTAELLVQLDQALTTAIEQNLAPSVGP